MCFLFHFIFFFLSFLTNPPLLLYSLSPPFPFPSSPLREGQWLIAHKHPFFLLLRKKRERFLILFVIAVVAVLFLLSFLFSVSYLFFFFFLSFFVDSSNTPHRARCSRYTRLIIIFIIILIWIFSHLIFYFFILINTTRWSQSK